MLRCPFNNFSKCDGNCPFSTENFNACKLASALAIIEGLGRSQVAQATTTNAHLVEIKEKLDALRKPVAPSGSENGNTRWQTCRHPDQPRLMMATGNTSNTRLVIAGEAGVEVYEALGERVSYSITAKSEVLVFAGTERKLSPSNGKAKNTSGTRVVSMQSDAERIINLFGDVRIVYMDMEAHSGIFRFVPTGEVE